MKVDSTIYKLSSDNQTDRQTDKQTETDGWTNERSFAFLELLTEPL